MAKATGRAHRGSTARKAKKPRRRPTGPSRRRGKTVAEETDEDEKFTYQRTFTQDDGEVLSGAS